MDTHITSMHELWEQVSANIQFARRSSVAVPVSCFFSSLQSLNRQSIICIAVVAFFFRWPFKSVVRFVRFFSQTCINIIACCSMYYVPKPWASIHCRRNDGGGDRGSNNNNNTSRTTSTDHYTTTPAPLNHPCVGLGFFLVFSLSLPVVQPIIIKIQTTDPYTCK